MRKRGKREATTVQVLLSVTKNFHHICSRPLLLYTLFEPSRIISTLKFITLMKDEFVFA